MVSLLRKGLTMNNAQILKKAYLTAKSRVESKQLRYEFSDSSLSSNGGVALFNEIEERSKIIKMASEFIEDKRVKGRSKYTVEQFLKSRIYPICSGYEDVNDLTSLRHDCIFKESLGIDPTSEIGLPSQPSISRFENSFEKKTKLAKFSLVLPYIYTKLAYKTPPKKVILDLDETFMPCHGYQQDSLLSGHESKYGYKPLFVIDVNISCTLAISDRPAKTLSGLEVKELFEPIFKQIRIDWPNTEIVIRGDSHYGRNELLKWCEETEGVSYITGFPSNKRLVNHEKVVEATKQIEQKFLRVEEKEKDKKEEEKTTQLTDYCTFKYKAEKWDQERKMVARTLAYRKGEEIITKVRFIITSIKGNKSPKHLYKDIYAKRGQAENIIKDVKRYLKGNRQSCTNFNANQVRLILHGLSHWFFVMLSRIIPKTSKHKKSSIPKLQMLLIKIAAQMKVRARVIQVILTCSNPTKDLFLQMIDSIHNDSVFLGP